MWGLFLSLILRPFLVNVTMLINMRLILFNIIVLLGSAPALLWLLVHFKPTILISVLLLATTAAMCISAYWLYGRFNIQDHPAAFFQNNPDPGAFFMHHNLNPFARYKDIKDTSCASGMKVRIRTVLFTLTVFMMCVFLLIYFFDY